MNNEFVILNKYQQQIELAINEKLPLFSSNKGLLYDACAYALSTGGKRVRPSLVFMVAQALGFEMDVTFSALGVEFFHTASLVADDLPAMDDDDERRNQPSVHKKFGEGAALLVTYALIAAGYECIVKNTTVVKSSTHPFSGQSECLGMLALENATYNTGFNGATGGQILDIVPPDLSLKTLKEIIHKKTSSLFEISFVFGWLFGGGDPRFLPQVKQTASHFGLAFQIADDLQDQEQDLVNGSKVNMANVFGREGAIKMFHVEHTAFLESLKKLNIASPDLVQLAGSLIPKEIHKL